MKRPPQGEACVHQQEGTGRHTRRARAVSIFAPLLLAVVCLHAAPGLAFQCGHRLVSLGEPQVRVWQKCGEPTATDWRVTYQAVPMVTPYDRAPVTVYVTVVTEVWVYNWGP